MKINTQRITRVTLVDETGRVYEKYGVEVELSLQDNGRTLKVFVNPMKNIRQVIAEMNGKKGQGWPPLPS